MHLQCKMIAVAKGINLINNASIECVNTLNTVDVRGRLTSLITFTPVDVRERLTRVLLI